LNTTSKQKGKPRAARKIIQDGIVGETKFIPDQKQEAPHNLDAERVVLASFMAHNGLFEHYAEHIKGADFFHPMHRQIFEVGTRLVVENKPANRATIASQITELAPIPDLSATDYLKKLDPFIKARTDAEAYVSEVRLASKRRAVLDLVSRFAALAPSADHDILDQLSSAVALLSGGTDNAGMVHMGPSIDEAFQEIMRADAAGFGPTGYLTGFHEIDNALGGLKPAKLYYVAAMEKAGKTALGLTIARKLLQNDIPVAIFSLEMKRSEIAQRLIAMDSGINTANRHRGDRLSDEEAEALARASDRVASWDLYCNDLASLTPSAIIMNARHAVKTKGAKVLIVDYVQIINPEDGSRDEIRGRVEKASRAMAKMAKELNVPVIALAQLNRKSLERASAKAWGDFNPDAARPRRGDLRETAQIEMDADAVISIYRPEIIFKELKPFDSASKPEDEFEYEAKLNSFKGKAELSVLLNRSGPDGVRCKCRFRAEIALFEPYAFQVQNNCG
jgi:replicative DNA helicase